MKKKVYEFIDNMRLGIIFIFYGVIFIIIIYFTYNWVMDAIRPKAWTLFIYNSYVPDTSEQRAKIDGYNNKRACIEKGLSLIKSNESFECNYDCQFNQEYLLEICDKVCNANSCRD